MTDTPFTIDELPEKQRDKARELIADGWQFMGVNLENEAKFHKRYKLRRAWKWSMRYVSRGGEISWEYESRPNGDR